MSAQLETAHPALRHQLLPLQEIILNNRKHDEVAIAGGYGSGKSTLAAAWHYQLCVFNPRCVSWILGPDNDTLRNVILEQKFLPFLRDSAGLVENIHFKVNRSSGDMKVEFFFGHIVLFKSANKQVLQGADISHMWITESGDCDEDGVNSAMARVRCPKASFRQTFHEGAPQGLNHFYKRFINCEPVNGSDYLRATDKKLVLNFPTFWNTFLPGYTEKLLDTYGHDIQLVKSWILGQFVPLFALNCFKFNQQIHIKDCPITVGPDIYLGTDFNYGAMGWVASQALPHCLQAVAETPLRCDDTDAACDWFIKTFEPRKFENTRIVVDGDASGWAHHSASSATDYDIIRSRLQHLYPRLVILSPKANGPVTSRIIAANRAFSKNVLYIHKDLTHTIQSLNSTAWDGKGGIAKPSGEDWTHRADALSYVVERHYPVVKPVYGTGAY